MIVNTLTLPWDIAILSILVAAVAMGFTANRWLKIHQKKSLWKRSGVLLVWIFSSVIFLVVFYGSFIEPQIITVTKVSLPLGTIEPLKIAIISDLHTGPYKGSTFIRRVVSRINALQPDIVLIIGDSVLTEEVNESSLDALTPLQHLNPLLGTYAILGNHDHGIYRMGIQKKSASDHSDIVAERMSTLDINMLRNTSTTIQSGENIFTLAGIDDALSGKANIVEALGNIPEGMPTILLSHNPDVILDPASLLADIIVTGHTHGGQIRLPWIGALVALPTHLGPRFDQGTFLLGSGTYLAITRGVGESGPRARLFAPPEIMLIETVPSER